MQTVDGYQPLAQALASLDGGWSISGVHGALSAALAWQQDISPNTLVEHGVLPSLAATGVDPASQANETGRSNHPGQSDRVNQPGQSGALLVDLVDRLVNVTAYQLSSTEFDYQLVLPDDEQHMPARLKALIDWCEAFTMTIALLAGKQQLDSQTTELLHAMARVQSTNPAHSKELPDEDDFTHICEYLRLGVIQLHTSKHT